MKYHELNTIQKENAHQINLALIEIGLTNRFLRAGIIAVVAKESGLIPKAELSWSTTSAARIRQVFSSLFYGKTLQEIDALKKDDKAFFNFIYGNRPGLGNLPNTNDGYNFRGKGYNQLTGRWNYNNVGQGIGVDLINNPDLLITDNHVAAKACAFYFRSGIVSCQKTGKFLFRHKIVTTSQISTIEQGAYVAHDCNGGFNIKPENDPTGGWQVVKNSAESYLELCK
jgi:putative chitinase